MNYAKPAVVRAQVVGQLQAQPSNICHLILCEIDHHCVDNVCVAN